VNGEKNSSLLMMVCILLALSGVPGVRSGYLICVLELVRTATRSHGTSTAIEGVVCVAN